MLSQLNEVAKNYEYIIKAIGALLPILLTILMIYIAYQQWIISKRNSNIEISKDIKESFYKPLRKYLSRLIYYLLIDKEKKESVKDKKTLCLNNIKNLFKKYPYSIDEYNNEIIKYSFKLFCRFNYKIKTGIVVEKSWKIYKQFIQWLMDVYIPEEVKINVYPNRFPNLYFIILNMVKTIYKFITPYCVQDILSNMYIEVGFFYWTRCLILHISIQSIFEHFKNTIAKNTKDTENSIAKEVVNAE